CAEKLAPKGIGFVDCPVSGGEPKAVDGTLAFMAGGSQEDFDALKPHFEAMGSSAVLVGDTGSGSIAKLVNQVIVNLNIAAVSEAFVLCEKAGADPQKVYEAIRGGLAGSTVLDAKIPKILAGDFTPGGTIKVNRKDINNVLSTAHACECPMPLSSQLFEIMQYLSAHGHLMDDHAGIVQYFEELADVKVRSH
ncbi:MAG: NAD-binding protein, partial [Firmicutes bacterium]|nr:NAD-binding protein [Bacillota bacterium]